MDFHSIHSQLNWLGLKFELGNAGTKFYSHYPNRALEFHVYCHLRRLGNLILKLTGTGWIYLGGVNEYCVQRQRAQVVYFFYIPNAP